MILVWPRFNGFDGFDGRCCLFLNSASVVLEVQKGMRDLAMSLFLKRIRLAGTSRGAKSVDAQTGVHFDYLEHWLFSDPCIIDMAPWSEGHSGFPRGESRSLSTFSSILTSLGS